MKRIICCLLILVLCFAALPLALAADEEPQTVTINYDDLEELVIAGSAAYQKELQEIRKLEMNYRDLSSQLRGINETIDMIESYSPGASSSLWSSASTLRANMRTLEERINEMKEAMSERAVQHVHPAQKMYVSHYILEIDLGIALRDLETMERELTNCRLKLPRGLSTPRDVRNAEKNVDNQKDLLEAKQDAIDSNLEALAKYLGLAGPIEPAGMPEIDFSRITERDLDADLAAYIAAASSMAEKLYDQAKKDFVSSSTSANQYLREIAREDFEKAKKDAEADFPKAYEDLLKAYDSFMDSTLVADAQEEYDKAASQYSGGLITQNTLLNFEMMLASAQDRYEQQRIQLWLLLMDYEFSLAKP